MCYKVFGSDYFDKKVTKILSYQEKKEFEVFIKNLKRGIIRGKPLSYTFFREKKIREKRIYFLVYREIRVILLVNASTKKYQKKTINKIKMFLYEYRELVYYFYNNY